MNELKQKKNSIQFVKTFDDHLIREIKKNSSTLAIWLRCHSNTTKWKKKVCVQNHKTITSRIQKQYPNENKIAGTNIVDVWSTTEN